MTSLVDVDMYLEKNYGLCSFYQRKDNGNVIRLHTNKLVKLQVDDAWNNLVNAMSYANYEFPIMLMLTKYSGDFEKINFLPDFFRLYYYIHTLSKYDHRYSEVPLADAIHDFLLSFALGNDYNLNISKTEFFLKFDNTHDFHTTVYSGLKESAEIAKGTFHEVMLKSILDKVNSTKNKEINFEVFEEMLRVHNLLHIANSGINQLSELADALAYDIVRTVRFIEVVATNKAGQKLIYLEDDPVHP